MSRRTPAIVLATLALGLGLGAVLSGSAAADTAFKTQTAVKTKTAVKAKTSYIEVLNDVMCVVCHEPLAVAQSPEAFQERQYIRTLIAQGQTRQQIEHNLVEQYGPAVLARPPAHGVNLLVYIVPPLVLILGLGTLAIFIPRWRRRARGAPGGPIPPATALDPADAQRLNEDLGRLA